MSKVDINLFLGPVGQSYVPITFSFNKNCRDPNSYNIRLIEDVLIVVCIVVILILCYPYVNAYWKRSGYSRYTTLPTVENKYE